MTFINKNNIPSLGGLKQSEDYEYNSTDKSVYILDFDAHIIVSVYNETINKLLYAAGNEDFNGVAKGTCVVYDNNSSGVSDSDVLQVLYSPKSDTKQQQILDSINNQVEQAKINNKQLSIITGLDIDKI